MKTLLVTVSERTPNNLKTGRNVRKARERAKISLRSMASAIGVDAATLSRLERGVGEWTVELVKKVEAMLQ